MVGVEFSRSALEVTRWRHNASMFLNVSFPPPETPSRESKEVAKVLWEIPLDIKGERPLFHVLADLSEDHTREGGKGTSHPSVAEDVTRRF